MPNMSVNRHVGKLTSKNNVGLKMGGLATSVGRNRSNLLALRTRGGLCMCIRSFNDLSLTTNLHQVGGIGRPSGISTRYG
jgi:hypothetical protein